MNLDLERVRLCSAQKFGSCTRLGSLSHSDSFVVDKSVIIHSRIFFKVRKTGST